MSYVGLMSVFAKSHFVTSIGGLGIVATFILRA